MRVARALATVLVGVQLFLSNGIECKKTVQKSSHLTRQFLESPFDICGESRLLNPVETVKAHAFATKIFFHCVKDLVLHYAQKIRVPAKALYPLSRIVCAGVHILYAYFSEDRATHMIKKSQKLHPMLSLTKVILRGMHVGGNTLVSLGGGDFYKLDWAVFEEGITELFKCSSRSGLGLPLDGDYLLHTIKHVRYILLWRSVHLHLSGNSMALLLTYSLSFVRIKWTKNSKWLHSTLR